MDAARPGGLRSVVAVPVAACDKRGREKAAARSGGPMKGHDLLSGMANVPADMERVGRGLVSGCQPACVP